MLFEWFLILVGFLLLFIGGEGLVKGSVGLAGRFNVSTLVVGLTVIAFGTSGPELVVSVRAAIESVGGIAVGNVVGSNIMNIALILGICALIAPMPFSKRVRRFDLPVLTGATVLLFGLLWNGSLSRLEGMLLFSCLILYTAVNLFTAKKTGSPIARKLVEEEMGERLPGLPTASALVLLGFAALYYGSKYMVDGAVAVARDLGCSQTVIGLTVVALGTSLPELVTSVMATLKRETDLAVGTVIGSCVFNILSILGIASMIKPVRATGMGWVDVAFLLLVTLALLPIAFFGRRMNRLEGFFILTSYGGYLVWLLH